MPEIDLITSTLQLWSKELVSTSKRTKAEAQAALELARTVGPQHIPVIAGAAECCGLSPLEILDKIEARAAPTTRKIMRARENAPKYPRKCPPAPDYLWRGFAKSGRPAKAG